MSESLTVRCVDRSIARSFATRLAILLLGLAIAGGVAIAPAVGATSVQDDGTANDTANDTAATELQPIDVANASGNASDPVTIEGDGQTVTDPVALEDGLLVAVYSHEGESNFQADLWNESADERAAFLVNEIGQVEGATAVPVTAGNYSLDVTADGAWNVTLVQPNTSAAIAAQAGNATGQNGSAANGTGGDEANGNETDGNESQRDETDGNATDGDGTMPPNDSAGTTSANATTGTIPANATTTIASAPATASGEGTTVLGPIEFEGSVTVTGNHSGESNFQVELWRENATSLLDGAFVFNEIGQIEAAEARADHAGLSWIVVRADGEWDLQFD